MPLGAAAANCRELATATAAASKSRVVVPMQGHFTDVVELSAAGNCPGLLLSLSKDGNLRLWDVQHQTCLLSLHTDAFSAVLHPDATYIVTASRQGRLSCWSLQVARNQEPSAGDAPSDLAASSSRTSADLPCTTAAARAASSQPLAWSLQIEVEKQPVGLPGVRDGVAVDCMRFLPGDRLAVKSSDGRMNIWNFGSQLHLATWWIPGVHAPKSGHGARCAFGSTPDGAYLCAGNSAGDVYVFDASSGYRVAHVSAIKVTGPVRSCGLSDDCRHLLAVVGNGFLFRFQYCKPAVKPGKARPSNKAAASGLNRLAPSRLSRPSGMQDGQAGDNNVQQEAAQGGSNTGQLAAGADAQAADFAASHNLRGDGGAEPDANKRQRLEAVNAQDTAS